MSMETARQEIKNRIADPDFRTRYLAREENAMREWFDLHRTGYPSPAAINMENASAVIAGQEEARRSEQTEWKLATYLKIADLPPAAQEEIRRQQPISATEQQWAREELSRLKRDKGFVRKLLDGDRAASSDWTRLHQIITLPTATGATTYPVK
jgi:hypothetical protein